MKRLPMKSNRGITLIELLVVIMIVGILAAIAIPAYTGYLQRARRADAKTALEQLRASQEMRRAERGSYSTDLTELRTTWGVQSNPAGYYNIGWAGGFVLNANSFTARATPLGSQATDGWLNINQNGTKTSEFPDKWAK